MQGVSEFETQHIHTPRFYFFLFSCDLDKNVDTCETPKNCRCETRYFFSRIFPPLDYKWNGRKTKRDRISMQVKDVCYTCIQETGQAGWCSETGIFQILQSAQKTLSETSWWQTASDLYISRRFTLLIFVWKNKYRNLIKSWSDWQISCTSNLENGAGEQVVRKNENACILNVFYKIDVYKNKHLQKKTSGKWCLGNINSLQQIIYWKQSARR